MSSVGKFFGNIFGGGGGQSAPAVPAIPPPAPVPAPPPAPAPPQAAPSPPSFVPSTQAGTKQKAAITATSMLGAAATAGQSAKKSLLGA